MNQLDLLIKNVKIVDGSGATAFKGNLAVKADEIKAIFRGDAERFLDDNQVKRIVDGAGYVLAPGFIDIHTHSDLNFLASGEAASKLQQGVTTEVTGNCGSSPAPIKEAGRSMLKDELADYNLELDWSSYPEFLNRLADQPKSINVVSLIGHGAIRKAVAGFDDRELTSLELDEAKAILAEAMEAGAFGISSGLIYPPSSYGTTEELIELARVAADYGGIYTTHLRNEGCGMIAALKEAIEIGRQAEIPVQISHHKVVDRDCWGLASGTLKIMETARAEGVDITCDLYPYLATNTGLSSLLPDWAHEGGREKLLERIEAGNDREKILEYLRNVVARRGWENVMISELPGERYPEFEGVTLAELGESWKMPVPEALLKILKEQKLRAGMIGFAMCEKDLETVLSSRLSMIGSDGSSLAVEGILASGKPHPRNFGTFPRVLGKYVREKEVIKLETAIHKMTGKSAARLGLNDRGLLKVGFKADLILFAENKIIDKATFKEPFQYPEGIKEVWVAGKSVLESGTISEDKPGRLIRNLF
ncbi:MAG: N-acyl-D-amino-acid deacylase family protein [Bacillota bacterium]